MKELNPENTLIIGIGNSGRRDDGLGWAFIDRIKEAGYSGPVLYRYQLQIEDAEVISEYQEVIFVDASSMTSTNPFEWKELEPAKSFFYTTHRMKPEAVLALCKEMYSVCPDCYGLFISGEEWELKQGLSSKAEGHLGAALKFFNEDLAAAK